ncbi:hypothetical protein QQS21_008261 [Conoideocrella luteorostrata]|uniref:Uncharacterized protein n=1 Tax=Conoideocrella luteorostrata TaxID=1105319 RepID=A0AAJ0FRL5_9HYPO|nr:hypothetical protein QQS21_008261 [Conoideocrella luteorostrata]
MKASITLLALVGLVAAANPRQGSGLTRRQREDIAFENEPWAKKPDVSGGDADRIDAQSGVANQLGNENFEQELDYENGLKGSPGRIEAAAKPVPELEGNSGF